MARASVSKTDDPGSSPGTYATAGKLVFYDHKVTTKWLTQKDRFTYRADRPLKWLQRLCLWVLAKLRCEVWAQEDTVEVIVVRPKDVADAIFKQRELLMKFANERATTLFIGSDDFANLMSCQKPKQMMQFRAGSTAYKNGHPTYLGMNVRVIPWMKGVLVA